MKRDDIVILGGVIYVVGQALIAISWFAGGGDLFRMGVVLALMGLSFRVGP